MKTLLLSLLFAGLTLSSAAGTAATAVLAGGCFWCMEADFEKLPGVQDVVSGFTGGTHPDPTYNGGHDGHYEAVEITYDPAVIDYQGLLDHFWILSMRAGSSATRGTATWRRSSSLTTRSVSSRSNRNRRSSKCLPTGKW